MKKKNAVRSHPHVLITHTLVITQVQHKQGIFMLTQRTEMQQGCLFISKHTGLGKFCFKEKKPKQTKSATVRGKCNRRKAREGYSHGWSIQQGCPSPAQVQRLQFGGLSTAVLQSGMNESIKTSHQKQIPQGVTLAGLHNVTKLLEGRPFVREQQAQAACVGYDALAHAHDFPFLFSLLWVLEDWFKNQILPSF